MTGIFTEDPDKYGLLNFVMAVSQKLEKKSRQGFGGWDDPEKYTIEHLEELLWNQLAKEEPDFVDAGAYCMMLWNRKNKPQGG